MLDYSPAESALVHTHTHTNVECVEAREKAPDDEAATEVAAATGGARGGADTCHLKKNCRRLACGGAESELDEAGRFGSNINKYVLSPPLFFFSLQGYLYTFALETQTSAGSYCVHAAVIQANVKSNVRV